MHDAPLPDDEEARPTGPADVHDELARIADEQAALRRLATLVARGARPELVFAAVAKEVRHVLPAADFTIVGRFDDDRGVEVVGGWSRMGDELPGGRHMRLVGATPGDATVLAAAAGETGMRSSVSAPISVDGRPWGAMIVGSTREDGVPAGTGQRLAAFTELVATAIANAQAREELRAIADAQAALGRVAARVARGDPARAVFAAVAAEAGQILPAADLTLVARYEPDRDFAVVGGWSRNGDPVIAGSRVRLNRRNLATLVVETGRPARLDSYVATAGGDGDPADRSGGSAVGAPIRILGRVWGVVIATSSWDEPLPAGAETRLAGFVELVTTAIATVEAQSELKASRARTIAMVDETRRRIERDLHDGAQQRLVSLALQLRTVQAAVPPALDTIRAELDEVVAGVTSALDELREFGRGIHPAILSEGLGAALKALARRSPVPVELDLATDARPPERLEVAAYYVVSEALTNIAKHARSSFATVTVSTTEGILRVSVRDDGIGGADFAGGSGLVGLKDRVEALGGCISLASPRGGGTTVWAELPLVDPDGEPSL